MNNVRFLAQLLQKGVKVRYAEQAFQSGGQDFEKGTLLITATGNGLPGANLWSSCNDGGRDGRRINISHLIRFRG